MQFKHAFGVVIATLIANTHPVAQAAERLADDDFHENFLVSYGEYSDWPVKDRIQYMADWRRAWTNFELGLQQRGQRFAANTPANSWIDFVMRIFVPESFSAASRKDPCLVGGWREELTAQNLCPTHSHPCGDPADEGFECSAIYSHACVERLPVQTLSKRCSESAREAPLKKEQYNERRHALEDLLHDCQSKAFPSRFNDNCNLLMHDAKGIIEKSSKRAQEIAKENEAPKANQSEGRPKYCENNHVVRVYKSYGGLGNAFVAGTQESIRSGDRVEILGECDSACIDLPAMVPKERVCVAPNAKLGFHLYTLDPQRTIVSMKATNETFSHYHPEIRAWLKNKHLTVNKLVYLQGDELRAIFQSCEDLYAACRAKNGPNWRPAKRPPDIVPEAIR